MFNLHNKLIGCVPNVYRGPAALPIMAAASVIGTGASIYQGVEAKKDAKAARNAATATAATEKKKQDALIAKQEKLISDKQKKQKEVARERKERLAKNEMLSGGEAGILDEEEEGSLFT